METDLERKIKFGKIEFLNLALTVCCNHTIITLKTLYLKSYEKILLSLISLFLESQCMVETGTKIR
ncbi:hypothetical protein NCCP133_02340 [Cytobacillus sp. NCCP-133]|nr:hypothetical protein NCCP133_02340 [Cytobacillus sp. NCCP-133]